MIRIELLHKTEKLILQAEKLIPKTLEPDLPATKLIPNVPEWHDFEHKIWKLGDDLRLLMKANPTLQKNVDGHIIYTLQRMHATGFESQIKPFVEHEHAWIRNVAKKYLAQSE